MRYLARNNHQNTSFSQWKKAYLKSWWNEMKCIQFGKHMMGDWRKKTRVNNEKINLVCFPSHLPFYDVENRLFSGIQSRPKTSWAIPIGEAIMIVFVAASHQTGLDTRSKARKPIKVGIKGRERSETSRDSNPAGLCCSSTH